MSSKCQRKCQREQKNWGTLEAREEYLSHAEMSGKFLRMESYFWETLYSSFLEKVMWPWEEKSEGDPECILITPWNLGLWWEDTTGCGAGRQFPPSGPTEPEGSHCLRPGTCGCTMRLEVELRSGGFSLKAAGSFSVCFLIAKRMRPDHSRSDPWHNGFAIHRESYDLPSRKVRINPSSVR